MSCAACLRNKKKPFQNIILPKHNIKQRVIGLGQNFLVFISNFEQILVYWSNVDSPPSRHPNEARGMNGSFHRQWSRWRSGYGPSPAKPVQARPGSPLLPALLPTPAKIGQQFSLLVPFRCTFTLPLCLYPEFQSWDENFEIVSYCKNFHTRMYEIPFYMHCCNFITSKSGGKHFVIIEYRFCLLKMK